MQGANLFFFGAAEENFPLDFLPFRRPQSAWELRPWDLPPFPRLFLSLGKFAKFSRSDWDNLMWLAVYFWGREWNMNDKGLSWSEEYMKNK